MKASLVLGAFWIAVLGALLSFSTPAIADSTSRDMVSQALDLVQQAQDQGDINTSTPDPRQPLLAKALDLLGNETDKFHGHVGNAMKDIRSALAKIKKGDPYNTASGDIRKAYSQLHSAISIAT